MKMQIRIPILVASLALISLIGQAQNPPSAFVPPYQGIFTSPAKRVPTPYTPDAPITGNGDVGVVLAGIPGKICLYISKNDFWKAQTGYPEGGFCLPGGLNIRIPELDGGSFYAEQILANGNINGRYSKSGLTVDIKIVVPADQNLILVELSASGRPCSVTLEVWAQTGFESRNETGSKDGVWFAARHFEAQGLDWPSHVVLALNANAAGESTFMLDPGKKVLATVGICTNHESADYLATAIERAKSGTPEHAKRLEAANDKWWQRFWSESAIHIGDTLLEKYYYGSQFLLACCSRNTAFPPGLCGNSISADAVSAWEGDYHTNYNFQAPWWACYSSNHIGLTDPYDTPILEYMPKAKEHARTLMNCRGVYYPVGIGPKGFSSSMYPLTAEKMNKYYGIPDVNLEGGHMFLGQRSNAVFLTVNMFQRFYYTYDEAYARKVYPFIREVADFWEDYLKFEDGQYNNYNDNFMEVGPWGSGWRQDMKSGDYNNTNTLGLLKMFYKGILEMSAFLDVDHDRVAKWAHIREHLYPIPMVNVDGAIRIKAAEGGTSSGNETRTKPGFGRVMAYPWVFPSDITGVKITPEFAEILRKEIGRWDTDPGGDATWNNLGNGIETYFTTAVRVGVEPEEVLERLKKRISQTALPNLWVPQSGGLTETLSAIPSCINEMLLQSYEGMIRVFPAWPERKNASFENLRTYGAFLVSSELANGEIKFVSVFSEKGRECVVENPWTGMTVEIKTNGKRIKAKKNGKMLRFKTKPGQTFLLLPQAPNSSIFEP